MLLIYKTLSQKLRSWIEYRRYYCYVTNKKGSEPIKPKIPFSQDRGPDPLTANSLLLQYPPDCPPCWVGSCHNTEPLSCVQHQPLVVASQHRQLSPGALEYVWGSWNITDTKHLCRVRIHSLHLCSSPIRLTRKDLCPPLLCLHIGEELTLTFFFIS